MANEDNKQKEAQGFKVKDRRRFANDGSERSADEAEENKTAVNVNSDNSSFTLKQDISLSGEEEDQVDFSSFLVSLATQALVQLGAMQAPEGYNMPKNKEAAKHTIEILTLLKTKTAGNLDPTEANLLEDILHNLRIAYVQS